MPHFTSQNKEVPHLFWNTKFDCCVHKNTSLVHILNNMRPIHNFLSDFPKIHSNIIFLPTYAYVFRNLSYTEAVFFELQAAAMLL